MATFQIGEVRDPEWRDALTSALRLLGARRLSHAANGEVHLWSYRVGFRRVSIEWDIWTGLRLRGPPQLVDALADAVRPYARTRR